MDEASGSVEAGAPAAVDVVVVGAGPVGLVLAILLGQLGRSVRVIERFAEPYRLPRAVHFDHEVGRIFASCGIGDELRTISEPAEVYEWRNAAGLTLLRFGRIGTGLSGWPQSSMFNQPALEALLDRRAGSVPGVEVCRGVEVTSVVDRGGSVVVGDAAGATVEALSVVGCDGARSTVRDLLGVEMVDHGYFHDWLVVDVVLDEPRVFDPINVQICDPARPTTVVSGGPGRRRWEFMRLPGEQLDELGNEARAWELLEPWDVRPDNARLERHAVYTFQARHATRWRAGWVLLAGDAAHQMPPFAGQGMCAGVRDAANLAWKLDLVLGGRAAPTLLDTYQEERLPSVLGAIEFSMSLGKVICVPDPDEAAARDRAMCAAVTDELTDVGDPPGIASGFVHPDAPGRGDLCPQPTVAGRPTDDAAGVGWRLVTTEPHAPDTLATGAWPAFAALGGAVVRVVDPDADTARWFADRGAAWALQRPDFVCYGTAPDAAGAAALVDHLVGQLVGQLEPLDSPTADRPDRMSP